MGGVQVVEREELCVGRDPVRHDHDSGEQGLERTAQRHAGVRPEYLRAVDHLRRPPQGRLLRGDPQTHSGQIRAPLHEADVRRCRRHTVMGADDRRELRG